MVMDRVLIISAHPDDDILGCGGYLSKHRNSNVQIKVIFIAEGTSCRFENNELKDPHVISAIQDRNNCGMKALSYLGVENYQFYNLPCGRLDTIPIIEINKIIENEIKLFKPDTIFTHSDCDVNNDHRTINRSTMMATRPVPNSTIKSIFAYEVPSSTEWSFDVAFTPNWFVPFSRQNLDEKVNALLYYESEVKPYPFPRSDVGLITNARYRGKQIGVEYAEAFKLIRGVNN